MMISTWLDKASHAVFASLGRRRGPSLEEWARKNSYVFGGVRIPRSLGQFHFAFIGGTGGGKSASLYAFENSFLGEFRPGMDRRAFRFDPKNEALAYLRAMNPEIPIYIMNPLHREGVGWDACLDILDKNDCEQIARIFVPEQPNAQQPFFSDVTRLLLYGVLLAQVLTQPGWSFRETCLILRNPSYIRQMLGRTPHTRFLTQLLDEAQGETYRSIVSTIVTRIAPLETFAAYWHNAQVTISIREMTQECCVVLFGTDTRYDKILGPLNALYFKLVQQYLLARGDVEHPRDYVIIDEFAKLGGGRPVEGFLDLCELGRSRGVRVAICIQTPAQLDKLYGKPGREILLGQCQNQMLFRTADETGSEYNAKRMGRARGYELLGNMGLSAGFTAGRTWAPGGGSSSSQHSTGQSEGVSESYYDRPFVHPDEFANLPAADFLSGIHGFADVPRTGLFQAGRWRFHLDTEWLRRHVPRPHPEVKPYDESLRPKEHMYLHPFTREELQRIGLEPDPADFSH